VCIETLTLIAAKKFSSEDLWLVVCPRNKKKIFSVRTETNRNSTCFGSFSVCFAKPINYFFGLFRCFGSISKQPKQTDLFRNNPKKGKKAGDFEKIHYTY
jgi:hypothetical protein